MSRKAEESHMLRLDDAIQYDVMKIDQADKMKKDLQEKIEDMRESMRIIPTSKEINASQKNLQKMIEKVQDKASLSRDCAKDKNELQKQIDKMQSEMEKLKKHIKKHEKKITEAQAELETKVNLTQFHEVRELILKLPRYEDVEALKEYVSDNIETFRGDNTAFHKGFQE